MNVADLTGVALDYWVARSLHDFVREIYFTDSGETVSIRGNDRGRPWDGRFTPSTSWEAASAVLERAQRLEVRERTDHGAAHCIAEFEGGHRTVEGRGDSLRVALLRAFVESRFGDKCGRGVVAGAGCGWRACGADRRGIGGKVVRGCAESRWADR